LALASRDVPASFENINHKTLCLSLCVETTLIIILFVVFVGLVVIAIIVCVIVFRIYRYITHSFIYTNNLDYSVDVPDRQKIAKSNAFNFMIGFVKNLAIVYEVQK